MSRTFLSACSVILSSAVLSVGAGGTLRAAPQHESRPGEIRVQTDLVTIVASVTDASGRPVPDLTKDVFDLSEEGVPHSIRALRSGNETGRSNCSA